MAKKTRTELSTLAINTNLPDNTTELITPTTERAQLTDERESVVNYKDDLGGVPNAGKFLTVATDGESLTMVDEPSGVPDWVTFQTAAINLMKLLSGSSSGELQFLYDDAGVDTLGARISWSSSGNLIIGNNFFTAELLISNQFNFIQGGAVKLRIETTGDLTHNADIMALNAQQAFGSNPLYTFKFQGKVTGSSGGVYTFEEFANIKGGKENATENDKAGYLSFTTGIADGTLTERLRITSGGNVGIGTDSPSEQLNLMGANDYTSKIRFSYGSSGTSYYTNFGYNSNGNNAYLQIADGGAASTIMTWNYDGNVGIGIDNPLTINGNAVAGSGLHVNASSGYGVSVLDGADGSQMFFNDRGASLNSRLWRLLNNDGSFSINAMNDDISVKSSALTISSGGDVQATRARNNTAGNVALSINPSDSSMHYGFRVDSTNNNLNLDNVDASTNLLSVSSWGQVFMNTTSSIGTGVLSIKLGGTNKTLGIRFRADSDGNYATAYENSSGTIVGKIIMNASSTSYETISDYRLKENVTPITDALSRLNQLKPSRFNFIADADKTVDGFLAHEVQDIIPEAISGEKDAMRDEEFELTPRVEEVIDEEGNVITEAVEAVMETRSVPDYQGIDQSKIVPLLTAAIQEQQTIIADLITRLEALEA